MEHPLTVWQLSLAVVFWCVVATGCGDDDDFADNVESSEIQLTPTVGSGWLYGESVAGRGLIVERFGDSGPPVLILSAIHGNERPAVVFGERLRTFLQQQQDVYDTCQVFLITAANPDGTVYGTRHNLSDVDLNRNFPAKNFQPSETNGKFPLQEPESAALAELIEFLDPVAILSIHNPLHQVDYNGPAEMLAKGMAKISGIPFKPPIGGLPGSLGSWAGEDLQIPTITLELPPAINTLSGFEPAWKATEYFVEKASETKTSSTDRLDLDYATSGPYAAWNVATTAQGYDLRMERWGSPKHTQGGVLVMVSPHEQTPETTFVVERIRAKLTTRVQPTPTHPIWFLTVTSPADTKNADVDSETFTTLSTIVDQLQPEAVVYVRESQLAGFAFAGPFPQKLTNSLRNQGLIERAANLGEMSLEQVIAEDQQIAVLLLDVAPFVDTEADAEPYRKVGTIAADYYLSKTAQ
ncbi:MAG: DUF2817 domain-containing protein [Myxococcales bacterium]|nr:DUF2817 domain-containing protein [Myxococcales bacterium]